MTPSATIGEEVSTVYGRGKVTGYRYEDEMFAVALSDCGAMLFTKDVEETPNATPEMVDLSPAAAHANEMEDIHTALPTILLDLPAAAAAAAVTSTMPTTATDTPSTKDANKIQNITLLPTIVDLPPLTAPTTMTVESAPLTPTMAPKVNTKPPEKTAMELNVAYEAYEKMRKLNLELQCSEVGIQFTSEMPIDFEMCTQCLLTKGPVPPKSASALQNKNPAFATSSGKPLFPRLYKFRMGSQKILHTSQQTLIDKTRRKGTPCLLCASPSCAEHSSAAFRKENITLCNECVESLEFDFDDDSHRSEVLTKQVEHLVDLYDRALVLLQYSSQFMLQVALSLEASTERHNQVGVGGSSVGLVSGVLGVAAACTILTPAGPPLLIASLVFGGSATAVQTGSEALKYFSEPNKLADRMLALMGMVQAILSTTRSMRETTLLPYLDRAILSLTKREMEANMKGTNENETQSKVQKAVTVGTRIGSTAATGMATLGTGLVQEGAAAGRFMSRATTNLARSARFARFAGGALSAATLVLEARELTKTVDQIRQGNPCEKAEGLRRIHAQLDRLPSTQTVDGMCQSYAKVRAKQLATTRLLDEQQKMEQSTLIVEENSDEHDLVLVEEVVSSLEAQQDDAEPVKQHKQEPYAPTAAAIVDLSKSTLLERVQRYKERQERQSAKIDLVV